MVLVYKKLIKQMAEVYFYFSIRDCSKDSILKMVNLFFLLLLFFSTLANHFFKHAK
jgi:hypothetical protein